MAVEPIRPQIIQQDVFSLEGKNGKEKPEDPLDFIRQFQTSSAIPDEGSKGEEWLASEVNYTGKDLLNDKQFAHIHGDAFISGSSYAEVLEGYDLANTIEHYTKFLESLPSKYQSSQVRDVAKTLEKARDLLVKNNAFFKASSKDAFTHKTAIVERAKFLAEKVIEQTDDSQTLLKTPFTLPFSYRSKTGGHAMMLQFVGSELKIFNTGEGIDHDFSKPINGKIKYSPVLVFKNISLNQDDLERFFRGFLESRYPNPFEPLPPGEEPNAEYIYQKLLPTLGGKAINDAAVVAVDEAPKDFIMDQTAGFCAERVLHAFLRHHLPLKEGEPCEYKRLQYFYKEETLRAYYQQKFTPGSNPSGVSHLLFQKGLTKHGLRIEKLYDKKMLSEEEFRLGLAKVTALKNGLSRHEKSMREAAENARVAALNRSQAVSSDLPTAKTQGEEVSFQLEIPYVDNSVRLGTEQNKNHQISFPTKPFLSLGEAIDLIGRVENYFKLDSTSYAEKQMLQRKKIVYFHAFVECLEVPDPSGKKRTIWDDLNSNEKAHKELIGRLSALSKEAFETETTYCNATHNNISRDLIFIQAKLAAITCHLARFQAPLMKKYQFRIKALDSYLSTPFAATLSCTQQEEWKKIIDCLALNKDLPVVDLLERVNDSNGFTDLDLNHKENPDLLLIQEVLGPKTFLNAEMVAEGYTDLEGGEVPAWFAQFHRQQLQLLTALCHGTTYNKNKKFILKHSKKQGGGVVISLRAQDADYEMSSKLTSSCLVNFFSPLRLTSNFNPQLWKAKDKELQGTEPSFLQSFLGNYENYSQKPVNEIVYNIRNGFNKVAAPIELAKELGATQSKPETRALEIIQFFNRHPHLTQDPAYQTALELVLFTPNVLKSYLECDPHFGSVLSIFIKNGIDSSRKRNDLLEELFFLKLSTALKTYTGNLPNIEFPDPLERCLQLLKDSSTSHKAKRSAAFLLLYYGAQQSRETVESSAKLSGALFSAKSILYSSPGTVIDPYTSLELEFLWNKLHPLALGCLNTYPEFASEIASTVFESAVHPDFEGKSVQLNWTFNRETEELISERGKKNGWVIDLKTGSLYFEETPYEPYPKEIEEDPSFLQVFGNKPYRIIPERAGLAKVEYEIEKEKWGLAWVDYRWFKNSGQSLFKCVIRKHLDSQEVKFIPQVPEACLHLIPSFADSSKYHYWRPTNRDELFIVNQADQVVAVISLDDSTSEENNKRVVDINAKKLRLASECLPLDGDLWWVKDFVFFEDPKMIELWIPTHTQSIAGAVVKLPRYGLEFEVRESEKGLQFFCLQEPGFILESSHQLSIDQHPKKILLLKDIESGKRKALFPFSPEKGPSENGKMPLIEIALNKQGNFAPSSAEEHLFLAHLALNSSELSRQVEEAERQLTLAWSLHRPSAKSQLLLIKIIKTLIARREASVAGLGLKLLCQYEQWRHEQPQRRANFGIAKEGLGVLEENKAQKLTPFLGLKPDDVSALFSLYLKRQRNDPLRTISKEEQQLIIDFLPKESSIWQQLNSLQPQTTPSPLTSGKKITVGFNGKSSQEYLSWYNLLMQAKGNWFSEYTVLNENNVTFLTSEDFFRSFKAFLSMATGSSWNREELKKRIHLLRLPNTAQDLLLKDILFDAIEYPNDYQRLIQLLPEIPLVADFEIALKYHSKLYKFVHSASKRPSLDGSKKLNEEASPIEAHPDVGRKENKLKVKSAEEKPMSIVWTESSAFDAKKNIEPSNRKSSDSLNPPFVSSSLKLENAERAWLNDTEKDFALRDQQNTSKEYRIVEKSLGELKHSLEALAALEKEKFKPYAEALLTLINRPPDNQNERIKRALGAVTGKYQEITSIEQLIFAYLKGTSGSWKALNKALTNDECQHLDAMMTQYLQHATDFGRIQRQLAQIKVLETLYSKRGSSPNVELEIEETSEALANDLAIPRAYGPHSQIAPSAIRLCLSFEFLSDLSIRPKQIRIVQNILDGKIDGEEREFISQLIMGGGKSKVILPLLSLLLADGKRLAVLCIPKEQIEIQKEYLNRLSGGLFEKRGHTLSIERETDLDAQFVKKTWRLLKQIRARGEYLVVTPESLQALELKWHELRRSGMLEDNKMRRQLAKIFDLIGQSGYLLLDEADRVLDIRNELNFTEGTPNPIKEELCAQFTELYELLAESEKEIALMQNQQSARFETAWPSLQKRLATRLADSFCRRCNLGDSNARQSLADFLCNPKLAAPSFMMQVSDIERDRVGLMRAQLTIFLPLTLTRTGQKDYAFSKNPSVPSAIPASFCIPKEGSRFGTPYEAVNYTLQLILQQGMTRDLVRQATGIMQIEAIFLTEQNRPLSSSPLVKAFQDLLPEKNLLEAFTNDDFEWIGKQLQVNPEFALALAQVTLLPQIEIFPFKATHNAYNLLSLFHKTFGFTATPWNWGCWPRHLGKPDLDPGTDGLTLSLLMEKIMQQKDCGIVTATLPLFNGTEESLKHRVKALLDLFVAKQPNSRYRAVIDLGAQFKGMSNRAIAEVALEYFRIHAQAPSIKGVVFFEKDQMFVLLNDGKIMPYVACDLKPEELFTLYDNAHVIGTDIPQEAFAEAIVTIGENLYQKDLLQAVGRMRGLHKLQSVSFFIPDAIAETIKRACHVDSKESVSIENILTFAALNQARRQMEDTYRAAKNEIPALIRKAVVKQMHSLDKNRKFTEADRVFEAFDGLNGIFRTTQSFSPWNDFCNPVTEIPSEASLLEMRDNWVKALKDIRDEGKVDYAFITELLRIIEAWMPPNVSRMPKTVEHPDRSSSDNCVEVLQEVETEVNLNLNVDITDQEPDKLARGVWRGYDPFHPEMNRLKPEENVDHPGNNLFIPLNRILENPSRLAEGRKELSQYAGFFKGPLYVSYNIAPVSASSASDTTGQLFDKEQKPFEHVLVRETDNPDQPLEFYLIDQEDLFHFQTNLSKEKAKPLAQQAKVWIYTIYNKDYGLKTDHASPEKWMEHPAFLRGMTIIHLFSGFSYLTKNEEDAMKELAKQVTDPELFVELIQTARVNKVTDRENRLYAKILGSQAHLQGISLNLRNRLQREKPKIFRPTLPGSPTVQPTESPKVDPIPLQQPVPSSSGKKTKKVNRIKRFFQKIGKVLNSFGKWFVERCKRFTRLFKPFRKKAKPVSFPKPNHTFLK